MTDVLALTGPECLVWHRKLTAWAQRKEKAQAKRD